MNPEQAAAAELQAQQARAAEAAGRLPLPDANAGIIRLQPKLAGFQLERQTLAAQADQEMNRRVSAALADAQQEAVAAVVRDRALSFRQ